MDTVKTHEEHAAGRIRFQYYSGTLWMALPGGRKLAYLKPKLQPNRFGRMSLTFEGVGNAAGSGGWSRQETYGGKLSENATQATARDILTEAMWRLEKAGFAIIAHVHDEVIIEAPAGHHTVDEVCSIMAQNPDWCRTAHWRLRATWRPTITLRIKPDGLMGGEDMPHVLRMKDGKLITPFDLDDVLEAVEEYAGDEVRQYLEENLSDTADLEKNWMGCTGSMRRSWNAKVTTNGRF